MSIRLVAETVVHPGAARGSAETPDPHLLEFLWADCGAQKDCVPKSGRLSLQNARAKVVADGLRRGRGEGYENRIMDQQNSHVMDS